MHVKWSDYIFAVVVPAICGAGIGLLVNLVLAFFGGSVRRFHGTRAHSPLVELVQQERYGVLLIWFGAAAVLGAVICVATIPRWQRPWYKGVLDSDAPETRVVRGEPVEPSPEPGERS
ncbi:MAG TPA: hypothetical protein VHI52_18070 [Verrucomicrobiae bacterium]|nr:hypothetical protein [Verrucomicrobiae bacterium]